MADVRVVPSSLSKEGNVIAFIERLDGTAFSADIDVIGFANMSLPVQIDSPDGRIYFVPPGGQDGAFSEISLPSGDVLTFGSDVSYVDEQMACIQSLRAQLGVLRGLSQARVASDRTQGTAEDTVAERYWAVLSNGHLHFGDALEGVDDAGQATDPDAAATELNALADEHTTELENFQASAFPSA